ncbi:putative cyclin-dependent kinase F-2 [Dichanthelium oligosanthes]|uniref:[RNA-polymerase]-subunit kinase n=1 Tax=Dichanthelium oligosanthes TaxID=888268 RepID=A0A1E5WFQ6_9POAL|nr:putative cyclin-dependent kinase F-2 [Dichanthelium oligosanthes]
MELPAAAATGASRKRRRASVGSIELYEETSRLGKGNFGAVVKARHRVTGQTVAIKHLTLPDADGGFAEDPMQEASLHEACAGHPFIVGFHGLVRDPATSRLCLVMECVDGPSLHGYLHQRRGLPKLPEATVRAIMWQLLTAAKKMQDSGIVHRDIKPENILVAGDHRAVKICDFGLAMSMSEAPPYEQAGTLFYKAPEMMLEMPVYDTSVDTWSLGCVMAEIINGKLLFQGSDEDGQLCGIFEVLGMPDDKTWPGFSSTPFATKVLPELVVHQNNNLRKLFPEATLSKEGFEVLAGLLTCNPGKRLTADAALKHMWFAKVDALELPRREPAAAAGLARHHAAAQPTRKRMRVAMGTTEDYQETCCLGEGSFGAVVKARHRATGRAVAMKYLSEPVDGHAALLREAIFLKACAGNPFVVGFHGLAHNPATTELCLVMEYAGASLRDALRERPRGSPPLPEATVRAAMWQLLTGAKKMHDAHIIHRDIKPRNILIDDDNVVRFCDFGLAVYMAERPPYEPAGTLWYMAPEMLLGKTDYDALVDTWSLGCVMAELINGRALFKGADYEGQLCEIFSVLGAPDDTTWPWFSSTMFATEVVPELKDNLLREEFPETKLSKEGFEVLSGLLTCNPEKRLTAAAALKHPWFAKIDALELPKNLPPASLVTTPPRSRRARGCASPWAPPTTTRRPAASARSFGAVVKARHRATGRAVAIKHLSEPVDCHAALIREAIFLKACASNPFVVGFHGLARDPATTELCLVMECGGVSLRDALRPLPEATVRAAMWQLLTGAKKMHDAHIIHRDIIKPRNILVGYDDVFRFCDFGLAVYMAERPPYEPAGTLWYMAPEMLLEKPDYDALVDTWSLGCVMAELINGRALFQGADYEGQLCEIFSALGAPDDTTWPWFSSTTFATEVMPELKDNLLREEFPETKLSKEGFEVLSGLLTCNPDKRLTAAAALKHPWFAKWTRWSCQRKTRRRCPRDQGAISKCW